jgi:hypothetical protein
MTKVDGLKLVEWHDGVLQAVAISAGQVVLEIARCFVYRRMDMEVERYSIESCAGSLFVGEPNELSVVGILETGAWISSCEISDGNDAFTPALLLSGTGPGQCNLTLANGTRIRTRFASARLELREPLSFVENWDGPL